jgi:hypothetical protein
LAAALQDIATGLGGHALQKAMLTRALALLRLVRSFWHSYSLPYFFTRFTLLHGIRGVAANTLVPAG